jgi:hypothetical protein
MVVAFASRFLANQVFQLHCSHDVKGVPRVPKLAKKNGTVYSYRTKYYLLLLVNTALPSSKYYEVNTFFYSYGPLPWQNAFHNSISKIMC